MVLPFGKNYLDVNILELFSLPCEKYMRKYMFDLKYGNIYIKILGPNWKA